MIVRWSLPDSLVRFPVGFELVAKDFGRVVTTEVTFWFRDLHWSRLLSPWEVRILEIERLGLTGFSIVVVLLP